MTPAWTELSFIAACALLAIVMGTALVVLWLIAMKKIDLSLLLTDGDSTKASLSRFQFLLFTFVVVGLFLLLSIESGTFVNIPDGVLALMGISAGSYAVSKGITASSVKNAADKLDKQKG
jgi:hypothetical protein